MTSSPAAEFRQLRSWLSAAVLLLAVCFLLSSTSAWAQGRHVLKTHFAPPAQAHAVGRMSGTQRLNLALTLSLRNQAQLNALLQQLYDPKSPHYRQFLSVQQFTEQFGPAPDDYQKVIDFAQSYGLTVMKTTTNRVVLDVSGTVAQIEQAFGVTMELFQHPTENRNFYAPNVEPSVPDGLAVQGVSGLNNFEPPRPMGLSRKSLVTIPRSATIAKANGTTTTNETGSFCFGGTCYFIGSDMRAAYYGGSTLDGTSQAVGLFEFGPYNLSDVQNYFGLVGQPLNVPITNVLLDGVNGICGAGCDDGEEVIDIQQAISMAPNLAAVIVYEGNNDTDMFNQMATDDVAKQLSCSFGFLPADPQSDEPIFQEFAAQGQNLFVASGDGGAYYGNPANCANFSDLNGCVFYPADDPLITAAGGTDLTTSGGGGPWVEETGWIGSGGGFSTNGLAIPSYQVPVINGSNQGSATLRNIPDVAAEANTDNIFCANGGCFAGVGGTSLSAPRWAGFLALANQQADGPSLGFLNPTIYSLGQGADYSNEFHDILSGNNFNSGSPDMFSDVAGFDLVTGWGSPNGQGLLDAIAPAFTGPNFALASSPSTLNVTQGSTGTSTITVAPSNSFTGTVNLTVTVLGNPAGVTATITPTSVSANGSATLTVSTTNATPGGNFSVVVTGTSGGLSHSAYVKLALPGFTLTNSGSAFVNQAGSTASTITVNDVNGFSGAVKLSVSGLPMGVSATLNTPHTTNTATLTFVAANAAATGFTSVTVTGTSGKITQTTTITLAVSAALSNVGSGLTVNLSSAFDVAGVYYDGSTYGGGGLDGGGATYSANLLGPSRVLTNILFTFGTPNQLNAISGTGQTIGLPAGQFPRLFLLGTGVQGNQYSQTIVVHYTDGTSSTFSESFSDWFTPQNFPGEVEAVAMSHRNFGDGSEDTRTFNLYGYVFRLNSSKTVKSITLPNNPFVLVLAATLMN